MTWSSKQLLSKEDQLALSQSLIHMGMHMKLQKQLHKPTGIMTNISYTSMTQTGITTDTLRNILINPENE